MISKLIDVFDRPIVLKKGVSLSALLVLFQMTVARLIRGRRLLVLILLFSLPLLVAVLTQTYARSYDADKSSLTIIFDLIPRTLLPLTALIFASGMIQDEIEEQTLTYLLIRPIPRPLIYFVKLVATVLVTAGLTALFTTITYLVCYANDPKLWTQIFPWIPLKTSVAMVIALTTYLATFALISVFTKRTLVIGIAYIIMLESVIANVDFVIRKYTIMYQFRVLTIRWLDLPAKRWTIDLTTAPSVGEATLNLVIAAVAFAIIGSIGFSRREFRVKTPEGS